MNISETSATFASLAADEKAAFLASFAYELTVVARDTYDVGLDSLNKPARMRAINELQHRVTAFLAALLRGDPERYPDDVLVRIVLEPRDDVGLQVQISDAFGRMMFRTKVVV